MITSVWVEKRGGHSWVTVRWKGATIGTLTVEAADTAALLAVLKPAAIEGTDENGAPE